MSNPTSEKTGAVNWDQYSASRSLGRNRLVYEHHHEVVQDFIQFFSSVDTGLEVLDIGCSEGFFMGLLRELGFDHLYGVDLAARSIERIKAKGLQGRVANILNEQERGTLGQKDVVVLMDVLEHTEDPTAILKAISEILRPGGMLYLTVPIYDSWMDTYERRKRGITKLQQAQEHDPTHVQAFDFDQIKGHMESAGLQVQGSMRLYCRIPKIRSRSRRIALMGLLPSRIKGKFLRVHAVSK